jgi:glycosyltransferase involved in cell wall biosynthesis
VEIRRSVILEIGMGLKILLVSDHYPPFIGGAHRQTYLLGQEMHKRGHEVAVATVWHPGLPDVDDEGGVTVYRLKQIRTILPFLHRKGRQQHQPPYPDPVTIVNLRKVINAFHPDMIHAYGWITYSCAVALSGKDIPVLISARDYAYGCATRTLVHKGREVCSGPAFFKCMQCAGQYYGVPKGWIGVLGVRMGRRLLKSKVSGVHSISSYVHEIISRDLFDSKIALQRAGGDSLPDVIIPSFMEDEEEQPKAGTDLQVFINQLPEEPFILFVGALRLVKGLQQLLDAYERLEAAPPLVLIGTIEHDTPKKFPKGVVVLQDFPHLAVMKAWSRALFGVIPSLWPEPLGSVVYEGMSRGKAVIGTTPGGHTDMIIDHETGLLVPIGNVEALTRAMQELLEDSQLRERLGQAAKERSHLFTAHEAIPHFEQAYWQLAHDENR